jgi:exopolysaccharide biosynthesis polyprenyl glycosylphosphotransferase
LRTLEIGMKNIPKETTAGDISNSGLKDMGKLREFPSNQSSFEASRLRIQNENPFRTMIAFERKRSERSHKAYALALISAADRLPATKRKSLLEKIAMALSALTRDTDLIGWYRGGSVLGIIFTDIVNQEKNAVVSALRTRITETLRENLTREQLSHISIVLDCYPEDWRIEALRRPSNPALYPDVTSRDRSRRIAMTIKRMLDIVGSVVALVLCAPLFLVVAIAIKATSRGPVFFRQQRVGQYGKPFVVLKFRSMHLNNDESVHQEWFRNFYTGKAKRHETDGSKSASYKLPNDPRVTRVGRLLRRTSIDEVPQFINVLKGEMSLVGPRPPIPYEVDAYKPWHRGRVLQAKPGITGLWQVNGRSRVAFDEMVRLDLRYARTWSIWMDIKILLKTPAAVFFGEGAY